MWIKDLEIKKPEIGSQLSKGAILENVLKSAILPEFKAF